MIGNDIIDLNESRNESNWQRKGWLRKIFSAEELSAIHLTSEQESIVWLFWSMKEAAYKIFNRSSGKTFYAPTAFHCTVMKANKNTISGKVIFEDITYYTTSIITSDYIHTIAKENEPIGSIQTLLVNCKAGKQPQLLPHLTLLKDRLGLPYIQNMDNGKSMPASVSHHGNYFALVYG